MTFSNAKRLGAVWLALCVCTTGCHTQQDYEEAKNLAQKRFGHQKAKLKYLLAHEQFENGQANDAKRSIQEALALYDEDPLYYLLLAKIQIEQGQLSHANQTLVTLASLGTPTTELWYLKGLLEERLGQHEQAALYYQEALEDDAESLSYLMAYAEVLVAMNLPDEALQVLHDHRQTFSGEVRYHMLCGEIYALIQDHDSASQSFRRALTINPQDTHVLESYAMSLYWNGRYAEASASLASLHRSLGNETPEHVLSALAQTQMQLGDYDRATVFLRRLSQEQPTHANIWMLLAQCHIAMDDLRQALQSAQRAAQLAPGTPGTLVTLGYVHWRHENWLDARKTLLAAIDVNPRDITAFCLLGQVSEAVGQPRQAHEYYQRALDIDPQDILAQRLLAALQRGTHDL